MWSDRESQLDLLNVHHLVAAVEATVTADHLLPVTVGVFGDWGSGKSTVMHLAQEALKPDQEILTVHFNGWLFEGYEDAKAAILGTILDELADKRKAKEKAGDLFTKLVKRVNWLRLVGWGGTAVMLAQGLPPEVALVAAGARAAPEAAKKLIKEAPEGEENIRRTIRNFEDDFQELLKKTGVRVVVVFIDDLDRCLPTTIMDTLEAIRLFVFVPGMAFVIAADERLVRRAVRQHFPDVVETTPDVAANYPSRDVGREYLEKLIQVPVYVPPLSRAEIATYVNLLFAQIHLGDAFPACCERVRQRMATAVGMEVVFSLAAAEDLIGVVPNEALAKDLALAGQLGDVLSASVHGNPRQTKRFLNALLLRLRMAEARVVGLDRRATAKLMLLEYFKPLLFQALAIWQAVQGGEPEEIRQLEAWIREQAGPAAAWVVGTREGEKTEPAETDRSAFGSALQEPAVTLSDDLQAWVSEQWMRDWLALEPPLAGMKLAPYFFFARERTGAIGQLVAQLSPAGAKTLQQLLVPTVASHDVALKVGKDLSAVEAAGVFEALVRHTSTREGMSKEDSALAGLLRFVSVRPELQGRLAAYVRTLPLSSVGVWAPPLLVSALSEDQHRTAREEIFTKWKSEKGMLQRSTKMIETRIGKGT